MTGIDPVAVRQPRVRDREAGEGERIRYSPSIAARTAAGSKSLEVLIPVLYLKGISSGDFEEALAALVGQDAPGLSASTIARLKSSLTGSRSSAILPHLRPKPPPDPSSRHQNSAIARPSAPSFSNRTRSDE